MTENQKQFLDYWTKNMKGKVSVETDKVAHAYYLLNNKQMPMGCSNCYSAYAQELKNVYYRLVKEEEDNKIKDETNDVKLAESFIEQLSKQPINQPVKNKGGRPKKVQD